jgi:hypothetical protein
MIIAPLFVRMGDRLESITLDYCQMLMHSAAPLVPGHRIDDTALDL